MSLLIEKPIYLSSIVIEDLFHYDALYRSLMDRITKVNNIDNFQYNESFKILNTSIIHPKTKKDSLDSKSCANGK